MYTNTYINKCLGMHVTCQSKHLQTNHLGFHLVIGCYLMHCLDSHLKPSPAAPWGDTPEYFCITRCVVPARVQGAWAGGVSCAWGFNQGFSRHVTPEGSR